VDSRINGQIVGMDISDQPKGIYFMQVRSNDITRMQRIVIQ
jgi:hypothetical protein